MIKSEAESRAAEERRGDEKSETERGKHSETDPVVDCAGDPAPRGAGVDSLYFRLVSGG